ncbi:hypothetical protein F5Y13DRAFT_198015 [Hypoxylon sp. FL1857]|nr:hypothetical protein F5Y13DRAFT_198015 [Hypoxylon sp. FL1857]
MSNMTVMNSNMNRDEAGRREVYSEFPDEGTHTPNDNFKSWHPLYRDEVSYDDEIIVMAHHSKIVRAWFDGTKIDLESGPYKNALLKKDSNDQNIIHRTIMELSKRKKENRITGLPQMALDVIEGLVLQKPSLFTDPDAMDRTAMFEALRLDASMLFRVINLLISNEAVERLRKIRSRCERGQEAACPLWDVSEKRRGQCGRKKDSSRKGGSSDGQDGRRRADNKDGRFCLHEDIDVAKVLEENDKLNEILKKALEKAHKDDAGTACLHQLLTENGFDRGQKGNTQIIPLDNFRTLLWLCQNEVFDRAPASGYTPLQLAIQLYKCQSINYDLLFSVIESLVERCPESIFVTTYGENKKTAFRLLMELGEGTTEQNENSRYRVGELLKRTCIGFREGKYSTWVEKKKFLYWNATSRKSLISLS